MMDRNPLDWYRRFGGFFCAHILPFVDVKLLGLSFDVKR